MREYREVPNKEALLCLIHNLPELDIPYNTALIDSLKTIYKNVVKLGYNPVKYKYGSRRSSGRLYPISNSVGLQRIPRVIRNTIMTDYVELDISSAQPTFLKNLMRKNDIETPKLTYFIDNKKNLLKDNDNLKPIVCGMCNSDFITNSYKNLTDKPSWLIELKEELTTIIHPKIKDLYNSDYVKIHKSKDNAIGTLIYNLYEQTEENWRTDMLWYMEHRSPKVEVKNVMLNHDGIYIPKSALVGDSFDNLYKFIYAKYSVKIKQKELTDRIDISELESPDDDSFDDDDCDDCNTDRECADAFMEYMNECGHSFIRDANAESSVSWWFNIDTGLWYDLSIKSNKTDLKRYMYDCSKLDKKYKTTDKLQTFVLNQFELLIRHYEPFGNMNDFSDFKVMSSKHKLPFINGVFDFTTKELNEYTNKTFFTYKIQFTIDPTFDILEQDQQLKQKVHNVLLDGFLKTKEEWEYWLRLLGRGLAGAVDDKLMYCCIAPGNSGKGVWNTLLNGICGSYSSIFNTSGLDDEQYKGDNDKAMNWVISKRHSRLCIASELKDNMTLSCELVKKLVSGGDVISGRKLQANVIQYVPQTTYYLFLNDWFNKISKVDDELKRRLRFIRPAYNYLDVSSREYKNNKNLPHIRKADTTIKDWVVESATRNYVLHLILKYYKHEQPVEPECCQELFDEYIDDTDFSSTIKEYITITKDKRDFIKVKNVYSHIKDNVPMCKNLTNKYIKDILVNTMGAIYTNKKYMGEQHWSFIGIKLFTPEQTYDPTNNNCRDEYDSDGDL